MPESQPNPQLEAHLNEVTKLRQAHYSWDDIHAYYQDEIGKLRAAHYSDADIKAYYGGDGATDIQEDMNARVQQNVQANPGAHESPLDALVGGLTNSSTAALLGVKPVNQDNQGESPFNTVTRAVAETVGDLPVSIASAFVASPGVTKAASAIPGLGETGIPEAAGGIVGAFSAGAGPTLVKDERDAYIRAGHSGWNAADFIQGHGASVDAALDATKQGAITVAAGEAGKVAGTALERAGVGAVTKTVAKLGVESATYTAASGALQGKMPTMQDWVDGAVLLAGLHVAGHALPGGALSLFRARLQDHYSQTGENPVKAAERAAQDPVLRRQLMGEPNPPTPPGSSRTPVTPEPTPQEKAKGALPPDQHVIPRVAGSFDTASDWILKEEGGLTSDTGGLTKYGISAKANPGIDIAKLSKTQALEIYHAKYWNAIDADELPEHLRLAAFDSAVNEGVGQTKAWLQQSGGDLQKFMSLRAAKYAELARDPKYAPYAKSWAKRLRDLGASGDFADLVGSGPSKVGQELTPGEMATRDMQERDNEGTEEPEKKAPEPGEPRDLDADLKGIMDGVAPPLDPNADWLQRSVLSVKRTWGELFDPDHPIRKLVNAAVKGTPLDGMESPLILRRLSENTDEVAGYSIYKKAVNLNRDEVGDSLVDIMKGVGDGAEQRKFLNGYARARWAIMMADQGKETGIDRASAENVVAQLGDKYEGHFKKLVAWRNHTMEWLRDSGIVSGEDYAKMVQENDASIPGYRRQEDGTYGPTQVGGGGRIWNPLKAAKGSTKQQEPILQSLMQDAYLRRSLAEHNQFHSQLADLASEATDESGAALAGKRRILNYDVLHALERLKEEGIDDNVAGSLVKAMGGTLGKDEVPLYQDGKLYGVKYQDPEVATALRGYNMGARPQLVKTLAAISSIPRDFQTRLNPFFGPKLAIYDTFFQSIVNPDARVAVANSLRGVGIMLGKATGNAEANAMFDRWVRSGGAERIFTQYSKDQYIQRVLKGLESDEGIGEGSWNAIRNPYDAMSAYTSAWTTPLRLGRFARGVEKLGESDAQAAASSTEAAFHRPGYGGPVGKTLNSIMPYTLAHMNGLEKTARSLIGGTLQGVGFENKTVTGVQYSMKNFLMKGALFMTIPSLMMWSQYKDQEWYKAAPDWQKDNGMFIPLPNGGHFYLATGPLISLMFIGLPRRLAEAFIQDNPHAGDGMGESLLAALAPPGGLTAASFFTPFLEHAANYSFHRDMPIVPPSVQANALPAEEYNHYSSGLAREVAKFASDTPLLSGMKLSPPVVDNYITSWTGTLGEAALKAVDQLTPKSTPEPAEKVSDWPGIASWTTRYPAASSAPIEAAYSRFDYLTQLHGSIQRAAAAGDVADVKRLLAKDPAAAAFRDFKNIEDPNIQNLIDNATSGVDGNAIGLMKEGDKAMREAGKYANAVWNAKDLTPSDKRKILDATYAQMQVMAERLNTVMDAAHVQGYRQSSHEKMPDDISFTPPDDRVQP